MLHWVYSRTHFLTALQPQLIVEEIAGTSEMHSVYVGHDRRRGLKGGGQEAEGPENTGGGGDRQEEISVHMRMTSVPRHESW